MTFFSLSSLLSLSSLSMVGCAGSAPAPGLMPLADRLMLLLLCGGCCWTGRRARRAARRGTDDVGRPRSSGALLFLAGVEDGHGRASCGARPRCCCGSGIGFLSGGIDEITRASHKWIGDRAKLDLMSKSTIMPDSFIDLRLLWRRASRALGPVGVGKESWFTASPLRRPADAAAAVRRLLQDRAAGAQSSSVSSATARTLPTSTPAASSSGGWKGGGSDS